MEPKRLRLNKEDSLFKQDSFLIVHNGTEYTVNPVIFIQYSRYFTANFQTDTNKIEVNDVFEEPTFEAFVRCCQREEITLTGPELVNLLVVAEKWQAPTLITKIEDLIRTTLFPKDVLTMYSRLIGTSYPLERLERMMSQALPDYIDDPEFPKLPMNVIQKVIKESVSRLNAIRVVQLCFSIAQIHGIEAIQIISKDTFDNVTVEEVEQLSDLFRQCPYIGFSGIFDSVGRCIRQILSPGNEKSQFISLWEAAENGTADDAYNFFIHIQKEENEEPKCQTASVFLKIAAERGHQKAMYEWGRYLIKTAQTQDEHQSGIEFLIHSSAKGSSQARTALRPYLMLSQIPRNNRLFVYQVLSLQIFLKNLSTDNLESTKIALASIPFVNDEMGVVIIADNILRSVQIRLRNIWLYSELLFYLISSSSEDNYLANLKQAIFNKIIISLCNPEPRFNQFILTRFLYTCLLKGVYSQEELSETISEFIKGRPQFVKSSLILFYWFAPFMNPTDESYGIVSPKLEDFRGGMGGIDHLFIEFKRDYKTAKENKWDSILSKRMNFMNEDTIAHAIIEDNVILLIERMKRMDSNYNQTIENEIFDFQESGGQLSLIQLAALQGSIKTFVYLLQRGASIDLESQISVVCAIAGQMPFAMNFFLENESVSHEMLFKIAAEYDNMYAMTNLIEKGVDINCPDDNFFSFFMI